MARGCEVEGRVLLMLPAIGFIPILVVMPIDREQSVPVRPALTLSIFYR